MSLAMTQALLLSCSCYIAQIKCHNYGIKFYHMCIVDFNILLFSFFLVTVRRLWLFTNPMKIEYHNIYSHQCIKSLSQIQCVKILKSVNSNLDGKIKSIHCNISSILIDTSVKNFSLDLKNRFNYMAHWF